MGWLTAAWAVFKASKAVRWTVAIFAAVGLVALIVMRALAQAEARGALKVVAKADKETLKRIEKANHAEIDANSGSDRDQRLHNRFDRD